MIFFKKKAPAPEPHTTRHKCPICSKVASCGTSGEKLLKFINGDPVNIEIIDERNSVNRQCFTLNIMNDPKVGWSDVPIKYCPYCSKKLGEDSKNE